MSYIPLALAAFVSFFSGWVLFIILDGANNILTFYGRSYFFKRRLVSLFENPITTTNGQRAATWEDIQNIARKYSFNRAQILYNLQNMLADALAAEDAVLRKHHQLLSNIITECEDAKDFERLPKNIQKHIASLKNHSLDKQEHVFPFLESDILRLQEINEKAFKREALKSHISIGVGVVSMLITIWASYDNLADFFKNLGG